MGKELQDLRVRLAKLEERSKITYFNIYVIYISVFIFFILFLVSIIIFYQFYLNNKGKIFDLKNHITIMQEQRMR